MDSDLRQIEQAMWQAEVEKAIAHALKWQVKPTIVPDTFASARKLEEKHGYVRSPL